MSVIQMTAFGHSPEQDSNLGPSRIAFFEDCKAIELTTQPPWLDASAGYNHSNLGKSWINFTSICIPMSVPRNFKDWETFMSFYLILL